MTHRIQCKYLHGRIKIPSISGATEGHLWRPCFAFVLFYNTFYAHSQREESKAKTFFGVAFFLFAGSLEAAYSLNWGAREIWGKGGGETLALL